MWEQVVFDLLFKSTQLWPSLRTPGWIGFKKRLLFCDSVYFFLLYCFMFFWFSVTGLNNVYPSVVGWITFCGVLIFEVCYLYFVDWVIVLMFLLLLFVVFSVFVLCLMILYHFLCYRKLSVSLKSTLIVDLHYACCD